MKRSNCFSVFTLLAISGILSSCIHADIDDITTPFPPPPKHCPEGYIHQPDEKNMTNWDVCIASAIYEKADVLLLENKACPELNDAGVLQEENLEANICFTRKETIEARILNFRLTRDSTYANSDEQFDGQIRVDLANKKDAQCIGTGRRLSPLGIYCLVDIRPVYSLDYIHSNAEQYVEDVHDCAPLAEATRLANAYKSYMDFAYYLNDSITLENTFAEPRTRKNASTQLSLYIKSRSTRCEFVKIKEMTGVTN